SSELVEVEQEIKYIEDYLFIINKKYDDKIKTTIRIDRKMTSVYKTLKLLLQPIVENCIKHGFNEDPQNNEIAISLYEGKNKLMFLVEDNGKGIPSSKLKSLKKELAISFDRQTSKIGLHNVNQRIKLKFGSQYGIKIRSQESKYTKVYLFLPKIF